MENNNISIDHRIDATDEAIIKILQINGRESSHVIARNLNLNPSTVHRRLRRLLDSKIVRIFPVIEPARAGMVIGAVIALTVSPERIPQVLKKLAGLECIRFISSTTGRYDAVGIATFRSDSEISEFVGSYLPKLEGVKDSEAFICLNITKGRRLQYKGDKETFEGRLVSLLQQEPRQKVNILASTLKITEPNLRRRLNDLMSGGTLRITATVDPTSIPPRLIAIVGLDVIPGKVSFVQQQISKLPSAIFVSSVSGRFEMLFLLRVNMVSELAMIMNETISKIEGIRASETFVCLDVAKGGLIQL